MNKSKKNNQTRGHLRFYLSSLDFFRCHYNYATIFLPDLKCRLISDITENITTLASLSHHMPEIVDCVWQTALGSNVLWELVPISIIFWLRDTC